MPCFRLRLASFALLALASTPFAACVEGDDDREAKGPGLAAPSLLGGKADASGLIQDRGELKLGEQAAVEADIQGRGEFHAYEMTLPQGAELDLEITQKGSTRELDTTLHVYGPRDERGEWSSQHIAFDDDDGWGPLSRIRSFEAPQAGTYLVLVGTYSGKQNGRYRVQATCVNGRCDAEPELAMECAFGAHYSDLFTDTSAMTLLSKRRVTSGDAFTALERAQIIAAVASTYDQVTTMEEAFAAVDAAQITLSQLWDASAERPFVAVEFGAGDNSYGMIVRGGSEAAAAIIQDGQITACRAEWGPGRRACTTEAECASGYGCHDASVSRPGVCVPAQNAPGSGALCATSEACPGEGALVCAGESTGRGSVCVQSWMKRGFGGELHRALPDGPGEVSVELESYGLATVHTDVWLDLAISSPQSDALTVTLTNPLGTRAEIAPNEQGEYVIEARALNDFPGDEDANGTWTLQIVSSGQQTYASLYRFGLTIASRWD